MSADEVVPCTRIAQADEECDAEKMPGWVYDLLSPGQARHTSPVFRWECMIPRTDLRGPVKAVALAVGDHTDPKNLARCCPSVATLAADVSFSERTVIAAIGELRRRGFLLVIRRRKGARRNDSNIYVPAWPAWFDGEVRLFHTDQVQEMHPVEDDQVQQVHPGVQEIHDQVQESARPGAAGAGELSLELSLELLNQRRASLRSDARASGVRAQEHGPPPLCACGEPLNAVDDRGRALDHCAKCAPTRHAPVAPWPESEEAIE